MIAGEGLHKVTLQSCNRTYDTPGYGADVFVITTQSRQNTTLRGKEMAPVAPLSFCFVLQASEILF